MNLWCAVKGDPRSRPSLIVIHMLALKNGVDRQAIKSQLNAAGGIGPGAIQLYAPPLFGVRDEPIVIIFPTYMYMSK